VSLGCTDLVSAAKTWMKLIMLATYTNTENHPAVIRSRNAAAAKTRAGMVNGNPASASPVAASSTHGSEHDSDDSNDSGSETETETPRSTVARPKGESKEDRKARKAGIKAERSVSPLFKTGPITMHRDETSCGKG
jgi:protein LTV1